MSFGRRQKCGHLHQGGAMKIWARRIMVVLAALIINAIGVVLLTKISTHAEPPQNDAPTERKVEAPQIKKLPDIPKPKPRNDQPRKLNTQAAIAPSQLPKFPTLNTPRSMQVAMNPALNQSLNSLFSDLSRRPSQNTTNAKGLFDGNKKKDAPLDASSVDQAPMVRQRVSPRYPLGAERDGISGYVVLRGIVERDGSVSRVDILKSSPPGVFDQSARSAFGRWRFKPGRDGGKTVRVWVRKRLEFQLQ